MHANHKPEMLWYCSQNRWQRARGAGKSLMDRWRGHGRFVRPAMCPARLTHCHVHDKSRINTSLSAGLLKQSATSLCWKWLQACWRVLFIWGNNTWCHRLNTMVSSGMHVKFPKYFLKDFIQFCFVTLAGKHKDGRGKAVQKDICEDLSWAAYRRWKMFKVKAFICKQ